MEKIEMVNIADLIDPDDPQGRTWREVNNAKPHNYRVGALVELETGVRLFVAKQTRDCDGTPLYSLTPEKDTGDWITEMKWVHGYSEESLSLIDKFQR